MGDLKVYKPSEDEIFQCAQEIDLYLRKENFCVTVAAPALMMLSAKIAATGLDSDEHILSEYRKCLLSERENIKRELN